MVLPPSLPHHHLIQWRLAQRTVSRQASSRPPDQCTLSNRPPSICPPPPHTHTPPPSDPLARWLVADLHRPGPFDEHAVALSHHLAPTRQGRGRKEAASPSGFRSHSAQQRWHFGERRTAFARSSMDAASIGGRRAAPFASGGRAGGRAAQLCPAAQLGPAHFKLELRSRRAAALSTPSRPGLDRRADLLFYSYLSIGT
eukprot:SAG31_NODE_48_length_30945_cov_16.254263_19_plen_199_part_00